MPLEDVNEGDTLRVRPGEKDSGRRQGHRGQEPVDESMITGEPTPVPKADRRRGHRRHGQPDRLVPDRGRAGGQDTVLAQIVDMVAEAQRSRAPIQRVPTGWLRTSCRRSSGGDRDVCRVGVASAREPRLAYALVNAVAVLIVACPCALGLATPMSIMVGVGRGAKDGVLIKDAEVAGDVERSTLVVDKTGTLTEGRPRLTEIVPLGRVRSRTNCSRWLPLSSNTANIRWPRDRLRPRASAS